MDPERWQRLWSIFHDALEASPGDEREALLAERCARDPELRAEVDSLLAAHATGGASLPPVPPPAPDALAAELGPGEALGPYRVVRRIAEGGMGAVFEAEQERPVRRRVALKVVRADLASRELVRRFEAECQVLARMDHSSIARVLEAGATADGRPWVALELVDGPPIDRYCDARRLPVPDRVALVAAVCRAVHSAHQKGVIHRDLKAANILIADEHGRPVPKVIDFGIARPVDPADPDGRGVTRLGQLVGTPEAMSPEQAAMSGDLDTRTDVYSLGALLYLLATGVAPFDAEAVPLGELLRRIREEEPPPPSARVGDDEPGRRRATLRGVAPRQLRRQLRGELDWIVARAMARDREHRYGSAAELADELERFLDGRPVAAGPPSRRYRLRKLVLRHRSESAAIALTVAAVVGFGGAMTLQSGRLARALERAERERATADRVSEFLVELFEQPDPSVARGAEVPVGEVLERGADRIARDLGEEPAIQARLLETVGRVFYNLGDLDRAESSWTRALEIRRTLRGESHEEVAADLQRLGDLEFARGRLDRAAELAERSLAIRRSLGEAGAASVPENLHLLGVIARQRGDLESAERLHRQALEMRRARLGEADPGVAESWNLLGIVLRRRHDLAGAEQAYRKAYELWSSALGADHPDTATALNNLALVTHLLGDHRRAERLFVDLIEIRRRVLGPGHHHVGLSLANYGRLLHEMRELERAARAHEEAIAIAEAALGPDHPQVAEALADYGGVLAKLGRFDEALAAEDRARRIRLRAFGPGHPAVTAVEIYRAQVLAARGDTAESDRLFAAALAEHRARPDNDLSTAIALELWGLAALERADAGAAEPRLREAVALLARRLPAADRRVARAESALGEALALLGRLEQAEALLASSLARLESPENVDTRDARARLDRVRSLRARR
jgi:serine/threonine protein kinase/Tfp pilus assembly protein PilF